MSTQTPPGIVLFQVGVALFIALAALKGLHIIVRQWRAEREHERQLAREEYEHELSCLSAVDKTHGEN